MQQAFRKDKGGRLGEAYCAEIQHRLEDCIVEDDRKAKAAAASDAAKAAAVGGKRKKEKVNGPLLEMARSAYTFYFCLHLTQAKGGVSRFLGSSTSVWAI